MCLGRITETGGTHTNYLFSIVLCDRNILKQGPNITLLSSIASQNENHELH